MAISRFGVRPRLFFFLSHLEPERMREIVRGSKLNPRDVVVRSPGGKVDAPGLPEVLRGEGVGDLARDIDDGLERLAGTGSEEGDGGLDGLAPAGGVRVSGRARGVGGSRLRRLVA